MTLGELAKKLRGLFWFRWLTLDYTGYITLWKRKPEYSESYEGYRKTWNRDSESVEDICALISPRSLDVNLNLEEYTLVTSIDYSKCIVEVSDES